MPKKKLPRKYQKVKRDGIIPGIRLDSYGNIRVTFDVAANALSLKKAKEEAVKYK